MPVALALGTAVIGGVSTIAAANSASRASRQASDASSQANAANIALAQEQRARNEALFSQYLGDENMARAYLDALQYGTGSFTPGATGIAPSNGANSDYQLEQILRQQNPSLAAEWDGWERAGNSNTRGHRTLWGNFVGYVQAYEGGRFMQAGLDELNRQQSEGNPENATQTITRDQVLQMLEGTPLAQYANEDYATRQGLNEDYRDGAYDLADTEYSDITGQADANLARRLALEDDSYAAWLPQSQQAERDAINLNFSRGGVNGLIGDTRRGVGETTQTAAMERNRRRLEGYQAAYTPYFDEMLDASGLRGGRRQTAFDTYSGRRASDYDQFAGDRINSYADYVAGLRARSDRGYGARANIASGGQAFVDAATSANNNNADAQRDAAYQRGQIQQQLYGDVARIAGDAWGTIRNQKK